MSRLIPFLALAGALLAARPAAGRPPARLAPARGATAALSIGSPTEGRLQGGNELKIDDSLRLKRAATRWGLPELVSLLQRGARRVRARFPGSVVLIGDLSRRGGGDLDRHRSHESGRDADVGFYFVDRRGAPVTLTRFRAVDERGRAVGERGLKFDDVRNWTLLEAWLTDPGIRVQHIFVAAPLRQRLLRHARARGVSLPLLHRASLAMKQPRDGLAHNDHFHVRIACPSRQQSECVAEPRASRDAQRQRKRRGAASSKRDAAGSKRLVARIR